MASSSRTVTLRGSAYPVVLPSIRDPRLHVAAVIISIHVLGQLGLNFQVSVPQILAAILAAALLEVAITFAQTRALVWPASAMLTDSGVALILRVVGTSADDPWSFDAWYVFAGVAAFSLLANFYPAVLAHGQSTFPDRLRGRALTTVNFAVFVGVGVTQVVTGFLINAFPADASGAHPEMAYRLMFAYLAVVVIAGAAIYAIYAKFKKPAPQPAGE